MAANSPTIRSNKFKRVGDVVLDPRKHVSLAKAVAALSGTLAKKSGLKKSGANKNCGLRFKIHLNDAGQILLSPPVIHPEEAWLYKNPKALASLRRGIAQAAHGKRYNLGTFAEYADDEID
jgi:hypothetical protein